MNNEKRVVLLSLTILALLLTGFTWAYWTNGQVLGASKNFKTSEDANTIKIGKADNVEVSTSVDVTQNTEQNLPLVPTGYEVDGESVDELTLYYSFKWEEVDSKLASGTIGKLTVDNAKVLMKMATDTDSMFEIEAGQTTHYVTIGDFYRDAIVVKVKFVGEPRDQYMYEELVNEGLNISFDVTVTPVQ